MLELRNSSSTINSGRSGLLSGLLLYHRVALRIPFNYRPFLLTDWIGVGGVGVRVVWVVRWCWWMFGGAGAAGVGVVDVSAAAGSRVGAAGVPYEWNTSGVGRCARKERGEGAAEEGMQKGEHNGKPCPHSKKQPLNQQPA